MPNSNCIYSVLVQRINLEGLSVVRGEINRFTACFIASISKDCNHNYLNVRGTILIMSVNIFTTLILGKIAAHKFKKVLLLQINFKIRDGNCKEGY